jgi:heme-degrading monooxygenase HmoA
MYREELAPAVSLQPGNLGARLLVDRSSGAGQSITVWDSAESMEGSEKAVVPLRDKVTHAGSRIGEIDRLEVVLRERTQPPRVNSFVRVNEFKGAPESIDESIAFARDRVLPVLKAQKGFLGNVVAIDRATGRLTATSIWDSAANREASEAVLGDLRRQAGRTGSNAPAKVELYESAFVDAREPAQV